LRWVLLHGGLGVATGAIAIGTVATLRSTTIIITIRTTISTAMSAARDKVIGSTIRNTAEMPPMETGKQPISSADVPPVAPVVPVVRVALVVPEDPVVPAVRVVLVVPEDPVVLAVRVALVVSENLVEPAVRVALVVPESPAVPESPVVALELAIGLAVVPELVIGQVEAELEHVQGEAEPELVRAAVPLRTKSVTAAHRRGLVPLLGAEDLAAAAAETTREPAAAEAVIAWEVAE